MSALRETPYWIQACVLYVALTAWVFRGLLGRMTVAVARGPDICLYLWNTWWLHQSLWVRHVSPYYTDAIFYPAGISLLLHTLGVSALLPWLPLCAAVKGVAGVILTYNVAVLVSFPLSAAAMWWLAFEETHSQAGALVAGVLVGFSAQRLSQLGWVDLLSIHYLLFYLAFLLRAVRTRRWLDTVLAAACAALVAYNSLTHVLFMLLFTGALLLAEKPYSGRVLARVGVIAAIAIVLVTPLAWEFYRALFVKRLVWWPFPFDLVIQDAADPLEFIEPQHYPSFLTPPLARIFPSVRQRMAAAEDLFRRSGGVPSFSGSSLGYSMLVLTALGVLGATGKRKWFWFFCGCGALVLSLGPYLRVGSTIYWSIPLPYLALHALPGLTMSKAAYRFVMPAVVCLALVAAFGVRAACERLGRWRRAGAFGALALVAMEYCSVGPALQPMGSSAFAQRLAQDDGDYAVLYYPPGRKLGPLRQISLLEQGMWEQVVDRKRRLMGFIARANIIPSARRDPALRLLLLRRKPEAKPVPSQVRRLQALFASPQHRVKFLIVQQALFDPPIGKAFMDAMRARYPVVESQSGTLTGLLAGVDNHVVFYVGRELFEADVKALHESVGSLQAVIAAGAAAGDVAVRKQALAARWRVLGHSSTKWERATPQFAGLEREVATALEPGAGGRTTSGVQAEESSSLGRR